MHGIKSAGVLGSSGLESSYLQLSYVFGWSTPCSLLDCEGDVAGLVQWPWAGLLLEMVMDESLFMSSWSELDASPPLLLSLDICLWITP